MKGFTYSCHPSVQSPGGPIVTPVSGGARFVLSDLARSQFFESGRRVLTSPVHCTPRQLARHHVVPCGSPPALFPEREARQYAPPLCDVGRGPGPDRRPPRYPVTARGAGGGRYRLGGGNIKLLPLLLSTDHPATHSKKIGADDTAGLSAVRSSSGNGQHNTWKISTNARERMPTNMKSAMRSL